jgi:hypothetical protein
VIRDVTLTAGLLLAFLPPVAGWADDPDRFLRERATLIYDPRDEARAVARFKLVYRDEGTPGTPIITVDVRDNDALDDEGLSMLARLPYLQSVVTGDLTGRQVRLLARLRQLQDLSLYATPAGPDDLKALAPLPRLRSLTFGNNKVTEDHVRALADFRRLEQLHLSGCEGLTDSVAQQIARLKQLKSLALDGTAVTEKGLAALAALERLETLHLSHCANVTGRGLTEVARLPRLRSLSLAGCARLTDADLCELRGLKTLRLLDLTMCDRLSDKAVNDLQAVLPKCKIIGPRSEE